ncbi:uncharacterized protein LOC111620215 [Centruroides sculpturatus]|uniref:uncharacterized protein LOC111620215 n=1 Tax=Centruroides sculpturatus TaxID=218467 RepID=UPI000C6E95ED|nr:uncharacterized protein LOC111620215 [Centruroides sculpturatus]
MNDFTDFYCEEAIGILKCLLIVAFNRAHQRTIVICLTSFTFLIINMVIINEYIYRVVGSFDAFLTALYLTFILLLLYVTQIMRLLVKKYFVPPDSDNPGSVVILLLGLSQTFVLWFFPNLLLEFVSKLSEEHNNKLKQFQAKQDSN